MIDVAALSPRDLPRLVALETTVASGLSPETLASALTASGSVLLGAWQSEQASVSKPSRLIGYAMLTLGPFDAEIEAIGVLPDCRRHGVAGRLMERMMALAKQARSERLLLDVRETNTAAIGLYQAFGFNIDGRRKGYYPAVEGTAGREDALLMSREIER